ncbi:hypothetical protein BRC88_03695 [Halobacteriales archaeon QS_4_69_225]|nr:MAG: hypothetical protein BRC88_03695 [Halobacteriales archaeon QS_4_69_225]
MCDIVGCAAREDDTDQLLSGLGNLEYRGYDSAGDVHLPVPEIHPALAGPLANVVLQLVAYHRAVYLERSVDRPRSLARSVTVE